MTQISFIHYGFQRGYNDYPDALQRLYHQICMKVNGLKAVETKSDEAELVHLDKRMMSTPSVAVEGAKLETSAWGVLRERTFPWHSLRFLTTMRKRWQM